MLVVLIAFIVFHPFCIVETCPQNISSSSIIVNIQKEIAIEVCS